MENNKKFKFLLISILLALIIFSCSLFTDKMKSDFKSIDNSSDVNSSSGTKWGDSGLTWGMSGLNW
jgi:hypothetical protein